MNIISQGDKVTYINPNGNKEIGIVKDPLPDMEEFVSVVFGCAEDWDNYMSYTGVLVEVNKLRKGWDADGVLKHFDIKPNENSNDNQ